MSGEETMAGEVMHLWRKLFAMDKVVEAALVWFESTGDECGRAEARLASAAHDYRAARELEASVSQEFYAPVITRFPSGEVIEKPDWDMDAMIEEIVRLREQLAALQTKRESVSSELPDYDQLLDDYLSQWSTLQQTVKNEETLETELRMMTAERESVSSQLWDCMNERDGLKERLAATEIGRSIETFTAAEHVAALVAMGWTEYASEFGSYHSVIAPEKRDER